MYLRDGGWYDLGNILPTGLSQSALLADLTLTYTLHGSGVPNVAADLIGGTGVPEPASLGLLVALAGLGLMSRRRKSA